MDSGLTAMTALQAGADHIVVFSHSKNGKCMTLGSVGGLSGAGEPDVDQGCGGQ